MSRLTTGKWANVQIVPREQVSATSLKLAPEFEGEYDLILNNRVLSRAEELEFRHELLKLDRSSGLEELPELKTPGFFDKVAARIQGMLRPKIAAGSFMGSRAVSIDVHGGYQPQVDFEDLPDVDGWWIKAGEVDDTTNPDNWRTPNALTYLDRAYRMGKPALAYFFVNTAYWLRAQVSEDQLRAWDALPEAERVREYVLNDPQLRLILRQLLVGEAWMSDPSKLRGTPARAWSGIALDLERYWMSYSDWYANGANCQKVGDFWIKRTITRLNDNLKWLMMKGYIPTLPIYNYTGWWFTSSYSPSLGDWLCNQMVWLATWYWNAGSVQTTWPALKELLAAIPDTWRPKYVYNDLPEVIQISGDRFIIPQIRNVNGVPRTFDVNLHWQTKAEWYTSLGFTPIDPGDPGDDDDDDEIPSEALEAIRQDLRLLRTDVTSMREELDGLHAQFLAHTHEPGRIVE